MGRLLSFSLLILLLGECSGESLDLTGRWSGEARMIIDGEHKNAALRLDLVQSEGAIEGSIMWDDLRREITSGSSEGRKVRIESATEKDKLTLHGLFRNGSIDGRFAIKYDFDPEPFPGIFTITRQQ